MYTLWILEKHDQSKRSIASILMGDHAVRVFTSLKSLRLIVSLGVNRPPDVVIIDADDISTANFDLQALGFADEVRRPILCVAERPYQNSWITDEINHFLVWVPKPINPFEFNRFLATFGKQKPGPENAHIRFKNIELDCESLTLVNKDSDTKTFLTLKEAKILKLLLTNPHSCLSRDTIASLIWNDVRVTPRTIDSYISRIRAKLCEAEFSIHSIYGDGYILR